MTLDIGFIEPHLFEGGGIRRVIELSNGLVERRHRVSIYLPDDERLACPWMRCLADIKPLSTSTGDKLDVVIANDETQWHLPALFHNATRKGFFLLHDGTLYDKPGSWETLRAPFDLLLANSRWTAERAQAVSGRVPVVVPGGINPDHFRPTGVSKRYPVLATGDLRDWKGTDTIEQACAVLDLPLATYAPKNLAQTQLADEYSAAEVFVVGSDFEGFGQPGIEALACGVPLVTTDNGGCREYAFHEETALVVPPRDVAAMAEAIDRVRADAELRDRLVTNGLELVHDEFDWGTGAQRLADILTEDLRSTDVDAPITIADRRARETDAETPAISLIVLQWDQVHHTQRCVQSLRTHTEAPYELILVDNGSAPEARTYAEQAADVAILNDENRGFAQGMNQGLATARAPVVAFVNNDTRFDSGWDKLLLDTFACKPDAGIVVPAFTAAGNQRTVRSEPGDHVEVLAPFDAPPSAVVFLMRTDVARDIGGWGEEYAIAAAEDIDLCFKVWVNGLDVVFDQRVVVDHVSKGTAVKLGNWKQQWADNREVFLAKWTDPDVAVPDIGHCDPDQFERNRLTAQSVATWMRRYHRVGGRVGAKTARRLVAAGRPAVAQITKASKRYRSHPTVRRLRKAAGKNQRIESFIQRMR